MKRSIDSSPSTSKRMKKNFRISKSLKQCKEKKGKPYGEDLKPIVAYDEDTCVIIVADGHGGRDAIDRIIKYKHNILEQAFESAELGLKSALRVCENAKGGAMISVVRMGEKVQIASVGDCMVCVYSDSKLIHQQPIHDIHWYNEHKAEAQKLGIEAKVPVWNGILRPRQPWIDENGVWNSAYYERKMEDRTPETHPEDFCWYFRYKNGSSFATCSGAGHRTPGVQGMGEQLRAMKPIVCEVDARNCRVVAGSDGISNVIHPKESVMHTMSASILSKIAYHRWTEPTLSKWGTFRFNKSDDISVCVVERN